MYVNRSIYPHEAGELQREDNENEPCQIVSNSNSESTDGGGAPLEVIIEEKKGLPLLKEG